METNLPATRSETVAARDVDERPIATGRPVSVAFLPLAIVGFLILAFSIAAWTLAATTF